MQFNSRKKGGRDIYIRVPPDQLMRTSSQTMTFSLPRMSRRENRQFMGCSYGVLMTNWAVTKLETAMAVASVLKKSFMVVRIRL